MKWSFVTKAPPLWDHFEDVRKLIVAAEALNDALLKTKIRFSRHLCMKGNSDINAIIDKALQLYQRKEPELLEDKSKQKILYSKKQPRNWSTKI